MLTCFDLSFDLNSQTNPTSTPQPPRRGAPVASPGFQSDARAMHSVLLQELQRYGQTAQTKWQLVVGGTLGKILGADDGRFFFLGQTFRSQKKYKKKLCGSFEPQSRRTAKNSDQDIPEDI